MTGWSSSDPRWRRLRLKILDRDGGVCRIQGDGCTQVAGDVDHIVPLHLGGDAWAPDNLRAACAHCNRSRGGREGAAKSNEGRGGYRRLGW